MKIKQSHKAIIFTLIGFVIYLILRIFFSDIKEGLDSLTHNGLLSYTLTYIIIGTPIYAGTYFIDKRISIFKSLGLIHNPIKPFLLAVMFSVPMLLGGFLFFEFNQSIVIQNLIAGTIVIGFVEELFFRGFLFGQIFKYTRLGFISAIVIGAAIFGMGHLYQSQDTLESIGIFAVTFMGAILFAWLYVEWNYNLWLPVFLHSLMNLAWDLFEMDDTALGGMLPNILRGLTIISAIIFTLVYKRKQNLRLIITKDTLFRKGV